MTTKNNPAGGSGPDGISDDATAAQPHGSVAIVRRGADGGRPLTLRRVAQRHLDELIYGPPQGSTDPIDWSACHMDLGVPEREYLGNELAMAGWTP